MADDIRQKLVDEIKSRFETITTGNGYETNLGNSVKVWRDMEAAPFPEGELDILNIKDVRTESSRDGEPMGTTGHELTVHAEAATKDNSLARDKKCRKFLADMVKAIGTDRKWNDGTDDLAWDTRIDSTALDVKQGGEIFGGCQLVFIVKYRTPDFDPYTEQH